MIYIILTAIAKAKGSEPLTGWHGIVKQENPVKPSVFPLKAY